MIELIRTSAVPANLVQAAARGALSVPESEMIEILVHLALHNKIFGQNARMTLAGWDEKSCLAAASDPGTSREVLDYLVAPENLRPRLLPALLENPSVPNETLLTLAASGTSEAVTALRNSGRARRSPEIMSALASNANLTPDESAAIHRQLASTGFEEPVHDEPAAEASAEASRTVNTQDEADAPLAAYLAEHAAAIAAEGEKSFQPIGGFHGDLAEGATAPPVATASVEASVTSEQASTPITPPAPATLQAGAAAAPAKAAQKKSALDSDERGSALQKIARLDIKGRIQLAMKGDKEMRSILIRDGTKLVALSVLESPKITDGEVEKFASQKNVLEAVLRQITMKRRFMKNYIVIRNLVANPRTPLDISLGLMKNLLVNDLRNLASNKDVSETVRKLALKMFKQKSDPQKKSSG
jgi:hypothetical protein